MLLQTLSHLLLITPLMGAIFAGTVGLHLKPRWAQSMTIASVSVSCFISWFLFYYGVGLTEASHIHLFSWLKFNNFTVDWAYLIDTPSMIMILVVTSISLLVHIYSLGYMKDDLSQPRFFAYLSLFTFMMLSLVMANNLIMMFFGWEGVGLVSYLLIGFWMGRPSAANANIKAFIVNRFGDIALFLAIAMIYKNFNSFNYSEILVSNTVEGLSSVMMSSSFNVIDVICGLIFISVMTKSAQIPFYFWLPDSMEGPTPISALIHAATMVTAGIFLVIRMAPFFILSPIVSSLMILIGGLTIISAGAIALVQDDIKRVIAYSTISQLGYMVLSLGLSAYTFALFHLATHAVFKSLLFLAAGGVIMTFNHQQNMNTMGGLIKSHPLLTLLMAIGLLSLMGFPGLAGFFSKDLIVETAVHQHHAFAYASSMIGLFLTSLYSYRLFYKVCIVRSMTQITKHHIPFSIYLVLGLLASMSFLVGPLGFQYIKDSFVDGVGLYDRLLIQEIIDRDVNLIEIILVGFTRLPLLITVASVFIIHHVYKGSLFNLSYFVMHHFNFISRALKVEFAFNWVATVLIAPLFYHIGRLANNVIESFFIDRFIVDGSSKIVLRISQSLQYLQSGFVQYYFCGSLIGVCTLFLMMNYYA
ncbi:NADH-quinone oxidoreductase subunit L [bacterium]|nr:NADH-quinone oxidoreductase subunit L [bacterium]